MTVSQKRTRRDFVKAIGGTLAGVSLLATGRARGQAIGTLPSGYRFYRVLTAGQRGNFGGLPNTLGNMTGSVMMASPLSGAGQAYIYLHGAHVNTQAPCALSHQHKLRSRPARGIVRFSRIG
jgi:hypothetical protein